MECHFLTTRCDFCWLLCVQVGKEKMHFRPPEEQNDHKVTCGVNVAVLQQVLDSIQQRLSTAGVQANIITSGTGEQLGTAATVDGVTANERMHLPCIVFLGDEVLLLI